MLIQTPQDVSNIIKNTPTNTQKFWVLHLYVRVLKEIIKYIAHPARTLLGLRRQ